jgi:hypothetical protein
MCRTGYAYSLLMRPNKLETALFRDYWLVRPYVFFNMCELSVSLIPLQGGPCGVLACVQAYIMKHLLFTGPGGMSW